MRHITVYRFAGRETGTVTAQMTVAGERDSPQYQKQNVYITKLLPASKQFQRYHGTYV